MDATCRGCGRAISGTDIYYSLEGAPLCPACNAGNEVLEADKQVGAKIQGAGWSAVGLALLSFIFNPLMLVTIAAISSGVYALKSFAPGDERFTQHVKDGFVVRLVAIVGIVIAIARIALAFAFATVR